MDDSLDPALGALLADPRVALRRPPQHIPMAKLRAAANAFLERAPRPPVHRTVDIDIGSPGGRLAVRLYYPNAEADLPAILFLHGGGFVFGNIESHDAMARALANGASAVVAAVDYRLAPEHPFPAALEDCRKALAWLVQSATALGIDRARMGIAGDSAGGQLAVAVALARSGKDIPLRHLGLLYPLLDPAQNSASQRTLGEGYMLTGSFIAWAWQAYGGDADSTDPLFDLGRADLAGLPPTTIITAQFDPLRDEGERFAARLVKDGVEVHHRCYPGVIHGFAGLPHLTGVASDAIGHIAARLGAALSL